MCHDQSGSPFEGHRGGLRHDRRFRHCRQRGPAPLISVRTALTAASTSDESSTNTPATLGADVVLPVADPAVRRRRGAVINKLTATSTTAATASTR
jgi:hypothetical protein